MHLIVYVHCLKESAEQENPPHCAAALFVEHCVTCNCGASCNMVQLCNKHAMPWCSGMPHTMQHGSSILQYLSYVRLHATRHKHAAHGKRTHSCLLHVARDASLRLTCCAYQIPLGAPHAIQCNNVTTCHATVPWWPQMPGTMQRGNSILQGSLYAQHVTAMIHGVHTSCPTVRLKDLVRTTWNSNHSIVHHTQPVASMQEYVVQ